MFGRLNRSHGDGRDGIGTREDNPPAHRLRDCSQPNITCPGNRARGSIFPHPYSGKISTPCPNGRLACNQTFSAQGRTGSVLFPSQALITAHSRQHLERAVITVRFELTAPTLCWQMLMHRDPRSKSAGLSADH